MEHLDLGEKKDTVARLAICVAAALAICLGGKKLCAAVPIPLWETWGPWMERNRLQAVAVVAAVLFGISLVVLPPKRDGEIPPGPEDGEEAFTPCA